MRLPLFPTLTTLLLTAVLARPAAAGINAWTSLGPEGGEMMSLAADPESPGTLYAGTVNGSVWKTVDSGDHWTQTTSEGLGTSFIWALAVSRGRVFAATDDGIAVLTEGAAAWRPGGPGSPKEALSLAVDPASPDRLWAATGTGNVLLSEDGGEHWALKLALQSSIISTAVVAPTAPPAVYVAGRDLGAFKSVSAGSTWSQIVPGDSPGYGPSGGTALSLDPGNPGTLYLLDADRVWKSTNAGRTWAAISPVFSYPTGLLALPGSLLAGTLSGLMSSEDGGATWQPSGISAGALVADPFAPAGAWIGSGVEGVFRTTDGGRTWQPSRGGLTASDVSALAFDPSRQRTLYLTAGIGSLYRSSDAGGSWQLLPLNYILTLAADPLHPGTLYATAGPSNPETGVWVSRDRGAHWRLILKPPDKFGIGVVAVDPVHPGTVFAGGLNLWRSRNSGRTWKILPRIRADAVTTEKVLFSPWHPETLYRFESIGLERSTDGGDSWEEIPPGGQGIAALAFDSRTPDLLYAADTNFGGIWKSHDGGTTWEVAAPLVGEIGVIPTALLVDPLDSAILYLGTQGDGLWQSRDHGTTWEPLSTGLHAPYITCLEADPRDPRHLFACTVGAGLLEIRRAG